MRLMYIDQLYTLYKSYRSRNSVGVIWGHWGQKVIFNKHTISPYRLHAMVMWLKYIDQLYTFYKSYWSRNSAGVFWGHWGQKVIFNKNAICHTYYLLWSRDSSILISKIASTKGMGLQIHQGLFGVTGLKRSWSPKLLLHVHINRLDHKTHAYTQAWVALDMLWGQRSTFGHLGSQRSNLNFHSNVLCLCYIVYLWSSHVLA